MREKDGKRVGEPTEFFLGESILAPLAKARDWKGTLQPACKANVEAVDQVGRGRLSWGPHPQTVCVCVCGVAEYPATTIAYDFNRRGVQHLWHTARNEATSKGGKGVQTWTPVPAS